MGEGRRREAGSESWEARESGRSGRSGARCARLPFWSQAAATAAGSGPGEREEPVRWERGGHVGLRGGIRRAAAGGEGLAAASHGG